MKWKHLCLITGFLFYFPLQIRADITGGLVAWLPMDQTNGLTAIDATTNAHSAALINFAGDNSQWIAGRTNGALNLNAAVDNQRAAMDDSSGKLNFGAQTNAAFTMALWALGAPGIQPNGAGVIAKGYGRGGEQFAIDVYSGAYRFFVRNAAGASLPDVRPGIAVDGTWQHVVATFDSADAANGLKLYINGQLVGKTSAPPTLFSNTHAVTLGSREDNNTSGYNLPFHGALDDVRIYNRALTAADVLELYQSVGPPPVIPPADTDALRLRWLSLLNGGTNLNTADPDIANNLATLSATAQSLWNSMDKSPARTYLWSDMPDSDSNSSQLWTNYNRLRTLSLALVTPGTTQYSNSTFRADLTNALDWMYFNRYNENKSEVDNWWHWEIGVPLWLNDITVLLYNDLTGTQITNYMNAINKFSPSPVGTGANLLWKAVVVAVRGAIIKDGAKLTAAVNSLNSLFPYVTSGDGFYPDGSFIQHSYFAYNGSYGSSLIVYLAPLMNMVNGSPWQITNPGQTNIYQWIYHAYQPFIYNGAMMDMVRGRAAAREDETDQIIGQQTIEAILRVAQFAPVTEAADFKSMVKYWIQSDTARNFLATADLPSIALAKTLLADTNVPARGELTGHYHFGAMDRVVHLRPGFGFGISMFSSRIANYESINAENLHGWYTGEGMTYLYNADQSQFSDSFWPTVNPYRLPGTTVDTHTRANSSGAGFRGTNSWVGGAALGDWGIAGMQLNAWNSTLTAQKSWFMFDDEIICLGAGITSHDNRTIETVMENRKLTGAGHSVFTVNGSGKPAAPGWSETMSNISWAHLAGSVAGADIGYYFPQPATLKGLREARSGSWYDLDPTEFLNISNVTRNYLTLWYDHGLNPTNAVYSYVLLPGKSTAQVAAYAANPAFTLLENSAQIQAVKETGLGITAANFWNDGNHSIGGITVNRKSSILLQVSGTNLSIAVADPTQTNTTGIIVTLDRPVAQIISMDPGMTVNQTGPTLQITVNTSGAGGKSFQAKFSLPNQPPVTVDDTAVAEPGMLVLIDVLANDSDPDHGPSPLSLQSVTTAAHGTASISKGKILYVATADFTGIDQFNYVVSDGNLSATGMVNVTVRYATNFTDFQNAHFTAAQLADLNVSGPLADPDGDGLSNLMEYALMTDPWQPDAAALQPQITDGHLTFTYTRRKLASDVSYSVAVSNDLVSWDQTESQFDETILSDNGIAQEVRISDKSPNASQARYFQLRVELFP